MIQEGWPLREKFMEKVEAEFRKMDSTGNYPVFYPGTEQRLEAAKKAYPAKKVQEVPLKAGMKPVVLRLEESDVGSHATKSEFFAPAIAEVPVKAASAQEFLEKVQAYINSDDVFGSLSCSLMLSDATRKELGEAWLDQWLKKQEWGTTAINECGMWGAIFPTAAWGAFPKHTAEDIQSGQGKVNNHLMYDHVEKCVIRGPFINPD